MNIFGIKKKVIDDMLLNLIATAIPITVLQLVILPMLSHQMGSDGYGLAVTMLSVFNVVPASFGNVLNNIRLLYENKYRENQYEGDFQIILLMMCIINFVAMSALTIYYENDLNIFHLFLILMTSFLWLLKEYYIVAFRIQINYKAILLNNLIMVIGYVIGFILYVWNDYWQMIYLAGYAFSLVYVIRHSNLWKEKINITPFFRYTLGQTILLFISGLFTRLLSYADRMLLYPMLGGTMVSIYFVATLFGKIVSMTITPVNSVVLTYLAKREQKNDRIFKQTFLTGSIVCIAGYLFCLILSRPVLGFLYPQYIEDAIPYILITTATSILGVLIGLVNPFIIKYFDMKWQMAINGGTVAVYIVVCLILLSFYGLWGFCIGALVVYAIKLLFMLVIYFKCNTKTI